MAESRENVCLRDCSVTAGAMKALWKRWVLVTLAAGREIGEGAACGIAGGGGRGGETGRGAVAVVVGGDSLRGGGLLWEGGGGVSLRG